MTLHRNIEQNQCVLCAQVNSTLKIQNSCLKGWRETKPPDVFDVLRCVNLYVTVYFILTSVSDITNVTLKHLLSCMKHFK